MTATHTDIATWIREAQQVGATHVIIAVDRFDCENYPIVVKAGESELKKVLSPLIRGENMQGVDEVYSFICAHPIKTQLLERRARHETCPSKVPQKKATRPT